MCSENTKRIQVSFYEYIKKEEENFLKSAAISVEELRLLAEVAELYQQPLDVLEINAAAEKIVWQLYSFVIFQFYFSVSCLMRAHLGEYFFSLRKAIDATLTVYKIAKEPNSLQFYLVRDKMFKNIKGHIKKAIDSYPLASKLVELHEICSRFGAHADIDSFYNRLEEQEGSVLFDFFQPPKNEKEYKYFFVIVLLAFLHILKIFELFFDKKKIVDARWKETLKKIGARLNRLEQNYSV